MTVETSTWATKKGLAQMLKGGVIMDVVTPEHAKIAEDAGAVAVMALERVPADIRAAGGVARMSDPQMIEGIMDAVSIPVMAKARIGHFVEAQILEALGVDYVDESEVLTPADETNHIDKHAFKVPFVCGCRNLGEALRRINEGAAMIRTKGEAGTGNVVEASCVLCYPSCASSSRCARTSCSWPPRSCRLRTSWSRTWPPRASSPW
jgi:pyridoxal 5'-phosphate synthase pdxS subunit